MLKFIVCLVVSHYVVNAKLRSRQVENEPEIQSVRHRQYLNKEAFSVWSGNDSADHYFHEFLNKMYDQLTTPHDTTLGNSESSKEVVLDVPNISFTDTLVLRYWSNPEQCSGTVVKMAAQYVGCRAMHQGSLRVTCRGGQQLQGRMYSTSDCSGEASEELYQTLPSCMSGGSFQCNSQPNPSFTEKPGLITYKFLNAKRCRAFANDMLHFDPVLADDEVDFDDYYRSYLAPDDDDSASSTGHYDNADACCISSELLERCPYPACPSSSAPIAESRPSGRNRTPVEGLDLSDPAAAAVPVHLSKRTTATQDMPAYWWLSQEKNQLQNQARNQDQEHRGLLVTSPFPLPGNNWIREYVLTQTRSNVCAYDETYQIWVKTSCNGAKNTLTYQLFADAECHFPMKTVDHLLTDVFPQYGKCAKSSNGDKRTSLLLCNGKNGVVAPVSDVYIK